MYTIYLVDDEANLNKMLVTYLEQEGYNVRSFADGTSAQEAIPDQPDLWCSISCCQTWMAFNC